MLLLGVQAEGWVWAGADMVALKVTKVRGGGGGGNGMRNGKRGTHTTRLLCIQVHCY